MGSASGKEKSLSVDENLSSYVKNFRYFDGLKPKFTWMGCKEELGKFIYLVFGKSSNADIPNIDWSEDLAHNMVYFKAFDLTFKLYLTTKTLCIQGRDESKAKQKLFNLIKFSESHSFDNSGEVVVADDVEDDALWEDSVGQLNQSEQSELETNEPRTNLVDADDLAKDIMVMKLNFSDLKSKVHRLLSKENMQIQSSCNVDRMTKEIETLRKQVDELTHINNNLIQKNMELESEKASLLTTVRLLNDQVNLSESIGSSRNENTESENKESQSPTPEHTKVDQTRRRKNTKKKKTDKTENNTPNPSARSKSPGSKPAESQPTTVILEDSIIKRLNSFKMSKATNTKVVIRSFPGARVRDMYYYVHPVLEETPKPCHVVLHIGTNDLPDKSSQEVADEIVDLARSIENKYPGATVCLSNLTFRRDSEVASKKVSEVNKITNRYCSQSDRPNIKHSNIDESSLNNYKLHLNSKGVAIIASNLTNYIIKSH